MDIYFTLCVIILYCSCIFAQSNEYYTGAVVDYNPIPRGDSKIPVHMGNNLKKYETYVAEAKKSNADIIVFPEYGLTTTDVTIDNIVPYTTVFPDPQTKTIACGNKTFSQIFANLSCIAKNHKIYLVVNLPERVQDPKDKKEIYFNTNIVFDRKGALIARYRKYNLFEEPGFSAPEKPEITYFETDFGVTFGTFTCFDILFSKPSLELLRTYKNITDIVYPTAWFSELPFLTAVQTQSGWARANGVNLLAAGYNSPQKGNGGSGIYQGGKSDHVVPSREESQVIVREIKKIDINHRMTNNNANKKTNLTVKNIADERMNLVVLKENMTEYKSLLLTENKTNHKECHNNLCCIFTVTFTSASLDYYYRLFVYDGMRLMGDMNKRVQICGLAACKDKTVESCGDSIRRSTSVLVFNHISISGNFLDKGGSVIFPSQVLYTLDILQPEFYNFSSVKKENVQSVEMKTTTQLNEILGFGIYSVTTDKYSPHGDGDGISGWLIFLYVIIALAILFAVIALGIYILRTKNRGNFRNLFQENEN